MKLEEVEGIGPAYAEKLRAAGVATIEALLEGGAYPAGRARLADETGIAPTLILTWVNHADLFRIHGIAGQYADLLEEAGVDTVVELAGRNAENLAAKLAEVNTAKNLTNRAPSANEVAGWVAEAKGLPRAVFYDDVRADASGAAVPAPAVPADVPSSSAPEPVREPAAPAVEPTPLPAVEQVPPQPPAPAPAPASLAAHAPAHDDRGWLSRTWDRIRGR